MPTAGNFDHLSGQNCRVEASNRGHLCTAQRLFAAKKYFTTDQGE